MSNNHDINQNKCFYNCLFSQLKFHFVFPQSFIDIFPSPFNFNFFPIESLYYLHFLFLPTKEILPLFLNFNGLDSVY